ncbi:MAG: integrase arm-type DNA-binding domain-containing protein [Methyloceanibacter sp.]
MKLTDQGIKSLPFTETGQREYHDDAVRGLTVRVGIRTKTFVLRGAGRKRHTLGQYPALTLAAAREEARDILAAERLRKTDMPSLTFKEALETYDRVHISVLRKASQRAIRQTFERHFRIFDGKTLAAIKAAHIAPVLDTMLSTPTERHNSFVYLAMFFNWAMRRGYIDTAPTARMTTPKKPPSRERVLSSAELVAIWQAAPDDDYGRIVRLCMLSGQRIGQWAGIRREYIQGDLIIWPSEVMKGKRTHTLPLTDDIKALLPERIGLLFPTINTRGFSNWSRSKERLDGASGLSGWTHHDLRRTWATVCAEELGIEPHIIESVLAHAIGTQIARTYNRARYLEPMRKALLAFEEWLQLQLSKSEGTDAEQRTRGNAGIHHQTASSPR